MTPEDREEVESREVEWYLAEKVERENAPNPSATSHNVSSVKQTVTDGEVRHLVRHYERMAKLRGSVNYDKVAALLTELLQRRKASA